MIYPRKNILILIFLILTITNTQPNQQINTQNSKTQSIQTNLNSNQPSSQLKNKSSEQLQTQPNNPIPQPVVVNPIKVDPVPISDEPVLVEDTKVPLLNNTNLQENQKPVNTQVPIPQPTITTNQPQPQKIQTNPTQKQQKQQKIQQTNFKPNIATQQHATNTGQAKNINPNDQTNQNIQKQKARLEELRKIQYQQKKAKGKQPNNDQHFENDRKLTKSQQIKFRERSEISSVYTQYDLSQPKKTVLFQVNTQIDQFLISPTTDIQIAIKMLLYTLENNAYGFVKDIEISKALKIYVYQNNDRIVAQGQFYFEKAIKFQAKAGAHYVIRFYNDGALKLVSFTYPSIIQHSQMTNVLKKQQGKYHLQEIHFLDRRIEEVTQRLRRNTLLDKVNHEVVISLLSNYSGYQFIQMLFVIAITIFQLQMVKKMFKVDSIL